MEIECVILSILVFKRGLYLARDDVDVGVVCMWVLRGCRPYVDMGINMDAQSPCPWVTRAGIL